MASKKHRRGCLGVPCAVLDEAEGYFFVYLVINDGKNVGW